MGALDFAHPAVRTWFEGAFKEPTTAQNKGWPAIATGRSTLLLAPTGSGKTLAAFLCAIDRLMFGTEPEKKARLRVLYLSPLKALGVDVERNLRGPLAGIRAVAERDNHDFRSLEVGVRSGDTPQADRARMSRHPPDILITTPESLYLMLTSNAREILHSIDVVIIDEIHAMVASKRGAHLFVSLERLEALRQDRGPLQRIGLSATQRPLDEVARLLAGGEIDRPDAVWKPRPVEIVDAGRKRALDLTVEVPVEDMTRLGGEGPDDEEEDIDLSGPAAMGGGPPSIWPAIHPRIVELVRSHRSTMIFVNSRRLAERLAAAINELAEEEIALAHHGSLAKDRRKLIEDRLKRGDLPAIVATSSLELGIDMGAVDLVIQIEAPPSVASGLQRVGRAGHHVGGVSKGVMFPKYRGDLLASAAALVRMHEGLVEATFYPR
ncbi:MAG: DEAD/DEAH box helicase, partial [Myxococcota bacterium]